VKTSDGRLFEDRAKATSHQTKLDFLTWYTEDKALGNVGGSQISAEDMLLWLAENKEAVQRVSQIQW